MQKTAYEVRISDWSSDVCSSDLIFRAALPVIGPAHDRHHHDGGFRPRGPPALPGESGRIDRHEAVGKHRQGDGMVLKQRAGGVRDRPIRSKNRRSALARSETGMATLV